MDSIILRLEEILEIKIPQGELAIFKKEFENFYLVPLKHLEGKIHMYVGNDR